MFIKLIKILYNLNFNKYLFNFQISFKTNKMSKD